MLFRIEQIFFLKIIESVIARQRDFRAHFMLDWNDAVPDRTKTFLILVNM